MSLDERKSALRAEMYARRAVAHQEAATRDPAANARLATRIGTAASSMVVSGFLPIRTEIDPTPTMAALALAGAAVCVPVIERKGLPLRFHRWTPGCETVAGAFGVMIPATDEELIPNLLITPLLAWSRAGWRLGYGGGFYDRTLERLRGAGPITAIGFAYATQEEAGIPHGETDQRLDAVVTEDETVERLEPAP